MTHTSSTLFHREFVSSLPPGDPAQVPEWVADAIFYQIFPDRFAKSNRLSKPNHLEDWNAPPTFHGFKGGDLLGLEERLEELKDLGVNALYLNPIFSSAANHRYHTYDYFQVDPLLGGNSAFKTLLDSAHKKSMRVILDGVFNHASRGLFQFNHVMENGSHSPFQDWFYFNPSHLKDRTKIQAFSSHTAHSEKEALEIYGYQCWFNLPALPKFNTRHPAVRDFLFQTAGYWIELGADGWRLDVPNEIDDDEFWREFRRIVKKANPNAYITGEIWNNATRWLKGDQFDAVMNYLLGKALLGITMENPPPREVVERSEYKSLKPLALDEFKNALIEALSLYPAEQTLGQMNVITSHDTPRLSSLLHENSKSIELIYALLFTLPGAPCIYYGDELGLSGRADPDCRGSYPETLHSLSKRSTRLREQLKKTIALRKSHIALRRGSLTLLECKDHHLVFVRKYHSNTLAIVANFGKHPCSVSFDWPEALGNAPSSLIHVYESEPIASLNTSATPAIHPQGRKIGGLKAPGRSLLAFKCL